MCEIDKLNNADFRPKPVAAGRGAKEGMRPGRHYAGSGILEGREYGIMKFGHFWRIGICIADCDIFTPS